MAQTPDPDTRIKAFGLAAHLLVESLIEHLADTKIIDENRAQLIFLAALQKCVMHELPTSPWQAEAAQAHEILNIARSQP
jgi:hypothetical protein